MIAVWFSCGAASAVAAALAVAKYGDDCEVRVVNNPVKEEDSDNDRFKKDIEQWIGREIETAIHPRYPSCSAEQVWADRKYMAGPTGAPCTVKLKKEARQHWENVNKPDWHVLGFTFDEKKRHDRFVLTERDNVLPVLIDYRITKQDCIRILEENNIRPPRMYTWGYPNANCVGCVKASSPTYWNHVRQTHPEVFASRAKQSKELGAKLVRYKGDRIFLDDLPPDAQGRPMKTMTLECGTFCEETE